jgi:predicted metal-dependent hydrolase
LSIDLSLSSGELLNIKVKRSTRCKHIQLKANIYGIHVVAPVNYDFQSITRFIHSRMDWISKVHKYYAKFVEKFGQDSDPSGNFLTYLGSVYKLQIVNDRKSYNIVSNNLKVITFHVNDRRKYKREIISWYKRTTSKIIFQRLPLLSTKLDLKYNRVLVKSQKSRWGSCSKNKNLNFNLLLSALPSEVVDYVIIHELIHLVEFNHSKRFWDLVKTHDPDYSYHRKVLRRYSCLTNLFWYIP